MSSVVIRQARAGLNINTLAARSFRQAGPSCFSSSRALRAYSDKISTGPTFHGQMLESVSSRIAREKAEREKFARQRQESAGTRRWATTFGTRIPSSGSGAALECS